MRPNASGEMIEEMLLLFDLNGKLIALLTTMPRNVD